MRKARGCAEIMKNWAGSKKFLAMGAMLFSGTLAAAQTAPSPHLYHVEGDVEGVHDPSIIAQNGTWYLFGTAAEKGPHSQLPMRCSNDPKLGNASALASAPSPTGSSKKVLKPETSGRP